MRLQVSAHGRAVHRELYSRDGFEYEITVYAAPGGLYGTWFCTTCGFTGVSQILSGTEDESLKLVQQALGVHHDATHASGSA